MRALNMQALTNDLKKRYPGIVIYGIGDSAHKLEYSDHNEDDTPGAKAAQTDSDNVPEHRAIDAMLSKTFTKSEADALVAKMVSDPSSKKRLIYIIWNGRIWSSSNNWISEKYNGDNPHMDHVHFSGLASDDENSASWPVVFASSGSGPTPSRLHRQWPSYMPSGHWFGDINGPVKSHGGRYSREKPDISAIQTRLNAIGFDCGSADGVFGLKTIKAVKAWQLKFYASKTRYAGQVWQDDWRRLFTY